MGRNHDFNPFLFPSSTFSSASASASSSSSSFSSSFFSSPSSPSLNSPNAQPLSNLPFTHSSFSPSSASSAAILGPCAACKILHGCTDKCYPESHKYTAVDRVFGATNIAMFLQNDSSLSSYVPMLLLLRDTSQDGEVQSHPCRNYVVDTPNKGLENTSLSLGGMVAKDPPLDSVLRPMWFNDSSSMFPQSFGVPDMAFNSISNSSIPQPISQRIMRTYTKVYKRGSLARSIDITRFSGYDELMRGLAMIFGIVGQLEDRQKVGWTLVYVDHENDILLVGNDPWEEFVSCVQSIMILSPQEVQLPAIRGGTNP